MINEPVSLRLEQLEAASQLEQLGDSQSLFTTTIPPSNKHHRSTVTIVAYQHHSSQ